MARYKDADALIKTIFPYDVVDKKSYSINAKAVYDAINNAPTADVVPRTSEDEEIALRGRLIANAKAEAVKEFAERLKGQIYIKKDKGLYFEKIDNLVSEMVGET